MLSVWILWRRPVPHLSAYPILSIYGHKDKESKVRKTQDVIALAKQSIRTNLHKSFESFAKDCEISLDKSDKEQADAMVARFQDIFKDAIGDIKPLAPFQQQKKMDDFLNSLNTVTVQ